MIFGYSILATALLLSVTAAYYSVAGLTAIFAAATLPIIIMGGSLELGKVVATVWLHNNWKRVPYLFKVYLIPAILFLMFLTSMGIFGFLSAAHLEHSTTLGDGSARVEIYDDKIATAKQNIEAARNTLKQLDATVNLTMDRTTDAGSVQSAANLRKRQGRERADLQKEIAAAQVEIAKLQELRAPLAVEARKIEAEVGPLKYIAALMYGDNPDSNLLERAVRWVIILIVLVFDPLALCLILAANLQFDWARHGRGGYVHDEDNSSTVSAAVPADLPASDAIIEPQIVAEAATATDDAVPVDTVVAQPVIGDDSELEINAAAAAELARIDSAEEEDTFANLDTVIATTAVQEPAVPRKVARLRPRVRKTAPVIESAPVEVAEPVAAEVVGPVPEQLSAEVTVIDQAAAEAIPPILDMLNITDAADKEPVLPKMVEVITEYVDPNTRIKSFTHNWVPETEVSFAAAADADHEPATRADFGSVFPTQAKKGDMYLRVDFLPARLHKFNGVKWMEVDKSATDSYAFNEEYIKYLIAKINSGEYSVDELSDTEQDQIAEFLNNSNNENS